MENEDIIAAKRKSRNMGGVILIIVGACLLLQRMDLDIPSWVFSWQTILIAVGILVGVKHNFRGGGWIAMILVGGIFLAGEILRWPYNTARFIWPVALIAVGLAIVLKKTLFEDSDYCKTGFRHKNFKENHYEGSVSDYRSTSEHDYINSSAIFSGINKIILSKDFKGGSVSSIFGGTDLNFMQADINGTVVLDVTAIFGGCEIVVPSNWTVNVDINTIMGGIEDKRPRELTISNSKDKILLLKGSCIFGGVEVKSYA
ncbi:LiaF transmembrane domain-containing protein [Chitinophaga sp. MM2321]|uniref:LiaF transmembrane domain-containing protein n=1 Tax=Chitinophaga sp. MM2321 TaxID=3137178 RepID=UPI0032D567B5